MSKSSQHAFLWIWSFCLPRFLHAKISVGNEMQILGLRLPLIKPGDDLSVLIAKGAKRIGGLRDGDVVVLASKALATTEGRLEDLSKIHPSPRAKRLAIKAGLEPEFVELVLREADRVVGVTEGAILTLKEGLLCANAGVDRSNVPPGYAALMPSNPNRAAEELRKSIRKLTRARVAVVVVDSNVKPLRLGTVGQAVGTSGFEPVIDCRGEPDLYGKPLRMTFRAIADQLATAAQVVMGEAAERIPVAILRDVGIELTEKPKSSPKIEPKKCIYLSTLKIKKQI